jgi:hypothetical protein
MAAFPTFGNREDSKKYGFDTEDVGIRSEMEGGYVLTRPRHTRKPRRTWTTGFTDLSNVNFNQFVEFWNDVGTYKGFTYVVRTSNEVVNVRFASKPSFKYSGFGKNFRWDIDDIKLEEV